MTDLEQVKDLQFAFKSERMTAIACMVVCQALNSSEVWPDEIDLARISKEDRNCVGQVYRWLCNAGILEHTPHFRKSKEPHAKGRIIFKYALKSMALAGVFLKRHHSEKVLGQIELISPDAHGRNFSIGGTNE